MMLGRTAPPGARAAPAVRLRRKADEAEAIVELAGYHAYRQEALAAHELPVLRLLRRLVAAHCRRAELAAREKAERLRERARLQERSSRSGA